MRTKKKANKTRDVAGIRCPECDRPGQAVLYTRGRDDGTNYRAVRCKHCGHRFRTRETIESVADAGWGGKVH